MLINSRTKIECASLCLSQTCSAFAWDSSLEVCKLAKVEQLGGPDLNPMPAFVDASKNLCEF